MDATTENILLEKIKKNYWNVNNGLNGYSIDIDWNDEECRKLYYRFLFEDEHAHKIHSETIMAVEELFNKIFVQNYPSIVYDIGSCIGGWSKKTSSALTTFPNMKSILFEANPELEFLYKENGWQYHMGLLGEQDGELVDYYYHYEHINGNSRYKENGEIFDENRKIKIETNSLDTVVRNNNFPLPDVIKIDVQGAELDVLKGANMCLNHTKILIVEAQHEDYNDGSPQYEEVLEWIIQNGFILWKGDVGKGRVDAD